MPSRRPAAQGLYDPAFEHDACGVSFVVHMKGLRSHQIVTQGVDALCNLEHRGASGSEVNTGDGAGILIQIPDRFLRAVVDFPLPPEGSYATGIAFLPTDEARADEAAEAVEKIAVSEGLRVLGWRDVPVDDSMIGSTARAVEPSFRQVFLAGDGLADETLERRVYIVRKRIEHEVGAPGAEGSIYFPSLSCRTLVYKGMLTTPQLAEFFPDLRDERVESALALVHSRFSTNTFPSWPLAHPFRYVAHNGEINTVQGNRNWMRAREALLSSNLLPGELERIFPICTPGASDSATFDEVLELLHMGGYSLPHAVLMMIPEAWENHTLMSEDTKAFYRYHASLMEPWDGPASIAFTDGTVIGAVLDRNGLRPSRYWVTNDDLVIMASEVGVLDIDPATVVEKGRLRPGRMFLVDTAKGRIVGDDEIKAELAAAHPYQEWLDDHQVELDNLPHRGHELPAHGSVVRAPAGVRLHHRGAQDHHRAHGPHRRRAARLDGHRHARSPCCRRGRGCCSTTSPSCSPRSPTRRSTPSARSWSPRSAAPSGPRATCSTRRPRSCRQIHLSRPIIDNDELAKLTQIDSYDDMDDFRSVTVPCLFPVSEGGIGLANALAEVRRTVSDAIEAGANIIVLSDRERRRRDLAPIPSLLATAAVHHHLIREKTRTRVGLVVECGDAREVHHMALLIGYGAAAVNPYLAFETIEDLIAQDLTDITDPLKGVGNYIKACGKGVLKVMSKMGISTVASYTGAQIFEAIGLAQDLVDEYFTGTVSRLGGVGRRRAGRRGHPAPPPGLPRPPRGAGPPPARGRRRVPVAPRGRVPPVQPGHRVQAAARHPHQALRHLQGVHPGGRRPGPRAGHAAGPVPLPRRRAPRRCPSTRSSRSAEIVKRFSTGAMSYGSISAEAHETLAIAMNRLGARSNTGEGGEDPERFVPDANGDLRRSAIKQVASGRFGVTSEYLVNADDLQIKMAQGAKPGEGGQLPGHKVYPWIAKTRHSTPGVGLISPPPHHDIYSIEDLAQLIHDLKNANPAARVHVKLVAEVGRRHGGGRRVQGPRRRGADLGPRRRHRRLAADLAQARRRAVGARPGRDPADAAAQRPARPHRRAGRRPAEDRARRGHRRAARRRGVRLRHRPAGRVGLRDDAGLPPRHLPGRRRHPEPGAAGPLRRQARVRRDLLRVHRRGGARAAGRARASAPSPRPSARSSCST